MKMKRMAVLLGLAAIIGAARADTAAVRKALQTRYNAYSQGFIKKDAAVIMAMTTPDFQAVMPGMPPEDRRHVEGQMKQAFQQLGTVKTFTVRIDKLKTQGNTATATTTNKMVSILKDPQGKSHTLMDVSVSDDTWVKTGGAWKIRKTVQKSDTTSIDGKTLPHMAPPSQ